MPKKIRKTICFFLVWLMTFSVFLSNTSILVKADGVVGDKIFDLVEITDFHGALENTYMDSKGVYEKVAGVLGKHIKDIESANPNGTLVVSGGDNSQGTALSNMLNGVPVVKFFNEIGVQASALGNHEFDWTLDTLKNVTMNDANFPILCANVRDKVTGNQIYPASKTFDKNGVKIAVIGAITTITPSIVMPSYVDNLNFTDPATEINAEADKIKAADPSTIIIAVIHEGDNYDNKTGPIFNIANKLHNVSAIFGGHTHSLVQATTTDADGKIVPIEIAKSSGAGFADLKMIYHQDGTVSFQNPTTAYVNLSVPNDPAGFYFTDDNNKAITDPNSIAIVDAAKAQVGPIINQVLCNIPNTLSKDGGTLASGFKESYLGDWSADVIKNAAGADVGMQNNGGLRINVPSGDVTVGTIYSLMPFDNVINTVTMTKAQLKVVLEQAVMDKGKGIQISGIKFSYNPTLPSMSRVTSITRENGTAISDTEKLKVAAPDFLATGGDGFVGFKAVSDSLVSNYILVRDALIADARTKKVISTNMDGRINGGIISVIATSDIHGNIFPIDYSNLNPANVGLAKISTYVKSIRAANPNVMLVDNGDTIQGTPLSYYYDKIDTTSEYPLMKVMGAMGYDTWTLGNHEFNYGLDTLNRIISDAKKENINVLSANSYKANSDVNFVKPYITKTMTINGKDIKIGILGMTTKTISSWENPSNYSGLQFNDLVLEAQKWVPIMKNTEKCDVIIATIHSGEESAADTIPENQIKAVAQSVDGIDAIVAGHSHKNISQDKFTTPSGKTVLVTEPTNTGKNVCQVDITVNVDGSIGLIATKNVAMDASIAADPAILTLAQPYEDATLNYVNTVIGKATAAYSGANQLFAPNALMDLINKVQMDAAGTQLSIAAPLSATAAIPAGDVKIKDMMGVYVYENFLYGVKMTGAQLKNWMEYSVRYYKQVSNPTDAIVKDSVLNIPDYNLDLLYGATYDVDLTQPACTVDPVSGVVTSGNRIKNLKFNGNLIKPTDVFTVAINNYRKNGGGNFMKAAGLSPTDNNIVTYDSAKSLGDDGQVRNLMISYIQKNKTITPTLANNWSLSKTAVSQQYNASDTQNLVDAINDSAAGTTILVSLTSGTKVDQSVLSAISGKNKTLVFSNSDIIWTINGNSLNGSKNLDLSAAVATLDKTTSSNKDAIKTASGNYVPIVISFSSINGQLPLKDGASISVKVKLDAAWLAGKDASNIYIYWFNSATGKLENIAKQLKIDENGYITFNITHCSDYVIADKNLIIPAASTTTDVATTSSLPKTGSFVDTTLLISASTLIILIGIVLVFGFKKEENNKDAA